MTGLIASARVVCTSTEFMYDDTESQSGRCLAVICRDLDLASRADWHDEGCILDFAATVGVGAPPVLDFGPGDGWPSLRNAPYVGRVVGVDTSKRRIGECSANAERLGIDNARFVHIGSETALPFADASFDGVVAASSVEQTPDPGRLGAIDDRVVEVRRCTLRHPSGQTWLRLLTRAGFRSAAATVAAGTLDGGTTALRLFEGRSAGDAPATHRELTRLLFPAVEEAVTVPAPIGSDPWITAVR